MLIDIAVAGAVSALTLAHLFALYKKVPPEKNLPNRTRNEAKGNANLQAGRNIRTYLPMDVDVVLKSYQTDKERLYKMIDERDARIALLMQRLPTQQQGFPLLDIGERYNLTEIHRKPKVA